MTSPAVLPISVDPRSAERLEATGRAFAEMAERVSGQFRIVQAEAERMARQTSEALEALTAPVRQAEAHTRKMMGETFRTLRTILRESAERARRLGQAVARSRPARWIRQTSGSLWSTIRARWTGERHRLVTWLPTPTVEPVPDAPPLPAPTFRRAHTISPNAPPAVANHVITQRVRALAKS